MQINDTSSTSKELVFTIPKNDIAAKYSKELQRMASSARIDGFRPGRVPLNVIERRYGFQVLQESVFELSQDYYNNVRESLTFTPTAQPTINFKDVAIDQDVEVQISIEYQPEVELVALKGIAPTVMSVSIGDDEVNETISRILKANPRTNDVADGELMREGDIVGLKLTRYGPVDSLQVDNTENPFLHEGADFTAIEATHGVDRARELQRRAEPTSVEVKADPSDPYADMFTQLIGRKKGDQVDIQFTYVPDAKKNERTADSESSQSADNADVADTQEEGAPAGEIYVLDAEIVNIQRRSDAVLDDELFDSFNVPEDGDRALQFRERIQANVNLNARKKIHELNMAALLGAIQDVQQLPIAKGLIEPQAEHIAKVRRAAFAQQYNLPENTPFMDQLFQKDQFLTQAEDFLVAHYLFKALVDKAALDEPTQNDIDAEIAIEAYAYEEEDIAKIAKDGEMRKEFIARIKAMRVFDWAVAQMKPKKKKMSYEEVMEAQVPFLGLPEKPKDEKQK